MKTLKAAIALGISFIFIASVFAPLHLGQALADSSITIGNGTATFTPYASGYMTTAYLNSWSDNMYATYFEVAYSSGDVVTVAGPMSYAHKDVTFGSVHGWTASADGLSAWSAAVGGSVGIVSKVAMIKGFGVLMWGVRVYNIGGTPLTAVRISGYQDADFSGSDEGHYIAPSIGPLKWVVYENSYPNKLADAYYGYTFANTVTTGHDWVGYSQGYTDAYSGAANNVNYYLGDGGGSAFVNLGPIPVGGSAVFYWVYGMSAPAGGVNGLNAQLLVGTLLAPIYAVPPTYSFVS